MNLGEGGREQGEQAPLLSHAQAASVGRSFAASWALIGIWGPWPQRQEMLTEQEKETKVPEGDLWFQRERERERPRAA